MGKRLTGRREGQEEMGVEALRHESGRDPVGEGNEAVDCRDKSLSGHKLGKGRGAVERGHPVGPDELVPAARARDQCTAFLERLADRGDLEWSVRVGAGDKRHGKLGVRRLHPPTRKDQRP